VFSLFIIPGIPRQPLSWFMPTDINAEDSMKESFSPKPFASSQTHAATPFDRAPDDTVPNPFIGVELNPAMDYIEKRDGSVSKAIAGALTLPESGAPVTQSEGALEVFDATGNRVEIMAVETVPGDLCPCCGQVVPLNAQELVEDDYPQRDSNDLPEASLTQIDSSGECESWQESF